MDPEYCRVRYAAKPIEEVSPQHAWTTGHSIRAFHHLHSDHGRPMNEVHLVQHSETDLIIGEDNDLDSTLPSG